MAAVMVVATALEAVVVVAAALEAVVVVVARSPALVSEECEVAEGQPAAEIYRRPLPQVLEEPYQHQRPLPRDLHELRPLPRDLHGLYPQLLCYEHRKPSEPRSFL